MELSKEQLMGLSPEDQVELLALLEKKEEYKRYNFIEFYEPYPFQKQFFKASKDYKRRFLCAANRVGKSFSEAMEMSYHLTGLYPDWWEGHKFDKPILAWAVGITGDSTMKVLQKELFGTSNAKDEKSIGTGTLPRDAIVLDQVFRDGAKVLSAKIRHYTKDGVEDGESTLEFRATQQGEHVLMGATVDYIWLDEEDPYRSTEIYAQCVTRTATTGGLVTITATPENGLTELVDMFMKNEHNSLYFQNATWDDALHLTADVKAELLASIPKWQHAMRTKGIPVMGSGLVYNVSQDVYEIEPFEIPRYFRQIAALDFGYGHPTVLSKMAYDADNDIMYLVGQWEWTETTPRDIAPSIKTLCKGLPVMWPHDGSTENGQTGLTLKQAYSLQGVPMHFTNVTNPGTTNFLVEPGVMDIADRMRDGRFKVFSTCTGFLTGVLRYHRKDGKINKTGAGGYDFDHGDSARYASMMIQRFGVNSTEAQLNNGGWSMSEQPTINY